MTPTSSSSIKKPVANKNLFGFMRKDGMKRALNKSRTEVLSGRDSESESSCDERYAYAARLPNDYFKHENLNRAIEKDYFYETPYENLLG